MAKLSLLASIGVISGFLNRHHRCQPQQPQLFTEPSGNECAIWSEDPKAGE